MTREPATPAGASPTAGAAHGWREVADGVYIRRYQPVDVTVTAIRGADRLAVVDTRCSLAEGRELREDLRRLSPAPVGWVINTHAHFDHLWGNAEFVAPRARPSAELWGHREVPAACDAEETERRRRSLEVHNAAWSARLADLVVAPPDHLVDKRHTLDLGDRTVDLCHLGRGHTNGDLVVRIPDANALLAGDLVEQSGPPAYGDDSFPLEWPATVDRLRAIADADTVIVPGHGEPVGLDFVTAQQTALAALADELTRLHDAGVPLGETFDAGVWPFPWAAQDAAAALARGYAALETRHADRANG